MYQTPDDFNTQLINTTVSSAYGIEPYSERIDANRCAIMDKKEARLDWDYDSVYASVDCFLESYKYNRMPSFDEVKAESKAQYFGPAHKNLRMSQHLACIGKLRTVVNAPLIYADDIDFNRNSMVLAKLPQWSMVINVLNHGFEYNNKEIVALSFSPGYCYSKSESHRLRGRPSDAWYFLSVAAFITDNSYFVISDVPLSESTTIDQALDETYKRLLNSRKRAPIYNRVSPEEQERFSQIDTNMTREMIGYLLYVLDNQDRLRDKDGLRAKFRKNPKRDTYGTVIREKLYGSYDTSSFLYVD